MSGCWQALQYNLPTKQYRQVLRFVFGAANDSHAACAELFQNSIVRDSVAPWRIPPQALRALQSVRHEFAAIIADWFRP